MIIKKEIQRHFCFFLLLSVVVACSSDKKSKKSAAKAIKNQSLYFSFAPHTFRDFDIAIKDVKFIDGKGNEHKARLSVNYVTVSSTDGLIKLGEAALPFGGYKKLKFSVDLSSTSLKILRPNNDAIDVLDIALFDSEGKAIPAEKSVFPVEIETDIQIGEVEPEPLAIHFDTRTALPELDVFDTNKQAVFTPVFSLNVLSDLQVGEESDEFVDANEVDVKDEEKKPDSSAVIKAFSPEALTIVQGDEEKVLNFSGLTILSVNGDNLLARDLHLGQSVHLSGKKLTVQPSKYVARVISSNKTEKSLEVEPMLLNNLKPSEAFAGASNQGEALLASVKFDKMQNLPETLNASEVETAFFSGEVEDLLAMFEGYLSSQSESFNATTASLIDLYNMEAYADLSKTQMVNMTYKPEGERFDITFQDASDIFFYFTLPGYSASLELSVDSLRLSNTSKMILVEPDGDATKTLEYSDAGEFLEVVGTKLDQGLYADRISLKGTTDGETFVATEMTFLLMKNGLGTSIRHSISPYTETEEESTSEPLTLEKIGIYTGIAAGGLVALAIVGAVIKKIIARYKSRVSEPRVVGRPKSDLNSNALLDEELAFRNLKSRNVKAYQAFSDILNSDNLDSLSPDQKRAWAKGAVKFLETDFPDLLTESSLSRSEELLTQLADDAGNDRIDEFVRQDSTLLENEKNTLLAAFRVETQDVAIDRLEFDFDAIYENQETLTRQAASERTSVIPEDLDERVYNTIPDGDVRATNAGDGPDAANRNYGGGATPSRTRPGTRRY